MTHIVTLTGIKLPHLIGNLTDGWWVPLQYD